MRLFPWRRRLPKAERAAVGLTRGEYVIAVAATDAGGRAVATDRALYLPAAGQGYERFGWETIARASWSDGVLHVSGAGPPGSDPPVRDVPLAEPGGLADAVHDRVTSTVVVSHHVRLDGRKGVRLIARRRPGTSGVEDHLVWSMSFDKGVDPSDPDVADRAATALEDVRRQLGV
ncbi:MAG: hypothetical protein ACRDYU_13445 [Actinomycetes bacterium]